MAAYSADQHSAPRPAVARQTSLVLALILILWWALPCGFPMAWLSSEHPLRARVRGLARGPSRPEILRQESLITPRPWHETLCMHSVSTRPCRWGHQHESLGAEGRGQR